MGMWLDGDNDFLESADCDRASFDAAIVGTVVDLDNEFTTSADGSMFVGMVLNLENEIPGYAKGARRGLDTVLVWGNKFAGYAEDVTCCFNTMLAAIVLNWIWDNVFPGSAEGARACLDTKSAETVLDWDEEFPGYAEGANACPDTMLVGTVL